MCVRTIYNKISFSFKILCRKLCKVDFDDTCLRARVDIKSPVKLKFQKGERVFIEFLEGENCFLSEPKRGWCSLRNGKIKFTFMFRIFY